MDRVAAWMTGSFDTFQQVAEGEAAGAPYVHLRAVMHIAPAALPWLADGVTARAFYVEQAAAAAQDRPYRQRVYLLTRRDGVLVNRIYRITDPEDLIGAHEQPDLLQRLAPERLHLEAGCDLIWIPVDNTRYHGVTGLHGTCPSQLRGATHTISLVELTADHILSLDQGFDDEGDHRWGPPPGTMGHLFGRRGHPAETAARKVAREFAELRAGGAENVFWYVEGTMYVLEEDGTLRPLRGVSGFNVARLADTGPDGDAWLRTHELFFTTNLERTELALDRAPIRNRVDFAVGVRDGRAVAGIGFAVNGMDLSDAVLPAPLHRVTGEGVTHFFTVPFVNAQVGERRWWAAEFYQFTLPQGGDPGDARLVWQRDNDLPGVGQVHWVATGGRMTSLEEMAAHSPLAAQVAEQVRTRYPELATAPTEP